MQAFMENVYMVLNAVMSDMILKLLMIAIVMDTIFGVGRAVKQHKFNSSFGIDGAIRKVSMVVSEVFLGIIDKIVSINLIGFIPEEVRKFFPENMQVIGTAAFFGLMYISYEAVSILKNMALCGLPVKGIWKFVYKFLQKYTKELPDQDELQEEANEESNRSSKVEQSKLL